MYKITEATALLLIGKEYSKGIKFNPVKDNKGQWYISSEEYNKTDITDAKEILKVVYITKDVFDKSAYEILKVDKVAEFIAKEVIIKQPK